MAAALMRALPPDCQLVLVGDPNQLPPVGPGHVLSGLLSLRASSPSRASAVSAAPASSKSTPRSSPAGSRSAPDGSRSGSAPGSAAVIPEGDLLPRVHLGEVFRQDGEGAIVSGALQIIKGKRLRAAVWVEMH